MGGVTALDFRGRRNTPFVGQTEAAECALACLAMVAGFHELQVDLSTLRRHFSVSLKGATLKSLIGVAEKTGFVARSLRGEVGDLGNVARPAILHWNLNHFVVLADIRPGISGLRYKVLDPAHGARWYDHAELSARFTGIIVELTPSKDFAPAKLKSDLKISQLWSKMSGLGQSLAAVLALSMIIQLIALAGPFYMQLAVDTALPGFDQDLIKMLAIGFGGIAILNLVTTWLRSLLLVSLGSAISYQLVVNLYRHMLRLPLPWFEKRHVGDVVSRFGSTQAVSDLLAQGLIAAVIDGIMALLVLAMMFIYSPLLAGVAIAAFILFAVVKLASLSVIKLRNVDAITRAAREQSTFIESVRGIAAVKAFAEESSRQRVWQQQKADSVNATIKLGRITAGFEASTQFVLALEKVLFVYIAVNMAMAGEITVGMIFAFQAYKQQFLDASTRLVDFALQFKILDVHLARVADIALAQTEPADIAAVRPLPVEGGLELRTVGFRYGNGEPEILRAVNLRIAPGEMVALVGPSGGGKTTLLKLMTGLLQPAYGDMLIDGKAVAQLGLSNWRKQIGVVMQDDILFAGTLADNIAFFDPEIDMDRVIEVAQIADVHETIQRMPLQYDTLVGDMGSSLSGGQKQRMLLARALYRRPKVLFIDEGTAHLDPATEHRIVATLQSLKITRIVVAHRSASIGSADRVFMVAMGKVTPVPPNLLESLLAPNLESERRVNV